MKKQAFKIILKMLIIISSLACLMFMVLACCYFRFDYLFISILCIIFAIYYKSSDFSSYSIKDLFKDALGRLIASYFIFMILSMFCNFSVNCHKPIYTYKFYQKNKPNLITEIFPEHIPESSYNEHFYMVEQGFMQGSPFVRLSYYADAETIENYMDTYSKICLASESANSSYKFNGNTYQPMSLASQLPEDIRNKETDFYIYYMEIPDGYSEHIAIVAVNKKENFVLFYKD